MSSWLLPLLARPHRHAPILRTKSVDTSEVFVYESGLAPRAAILSKCERLERRDLILKCHVLAGRKIAFVHRSKLRAARGYCTAESHSTGSDLRLRCAVGYCFPSVVDADHVGEIISCYDYILVAHICNDIGKFNRHARFVCHRFKLQSIQANTLLINVPQVVGWDRRLIPPRLGRKCCEHAQKS